MSYSDAQSPPGQVKAHENDHSGELQPDHGQSLAAYNGAQVQPIAVDLGDTKLEANHDNDTGPIRNDQIANYFQDSNKETTNETFDKTEGIVPIENCSLDHSIQWTNADLRVIARTALDLIPIIRASREEKRVTSNPIAESTPVAKFLHEMLVYNNMTTTDGRKKTK